ncbi:hypothetical protein PPERSA_12509 [Pseudocohnilembus persalinus]|uniref:Uncharacterized protein n=1 Tax=Pseudocohnilembus persalinus TaxID=266149 RepID=A0A0V0QP59_PSEPJ|nr:hypothetical protein PPERSA_12509 [Pseudocohnilembus persalinus]|eukprot:KRX04062.1 hypothetical protein PPERSA_12509 [Pseudocohnilembus persalinus]
MELLIDFNIDISNINQFQIKERFDEKQDIENELQYNDWQKQQEQNQNQTSDFIDVEMTEQEMQEYLNFVDLKKKEKQFKVNQSNMVEQNQDNVEFTNYNDSNQLSNSFQNNYNVIENIYKQYFEDENENTLIDKQEKIEENTMIEKNNVQQSNKSIIQYIQQTSLNRNQKSEQVNDIVKINDFNVSLQEKYIQKDNDQEKEIQNTNLSSLSMDQQQINEQINQTNHFMINHSQQQDNDQLNYVENQDKEYNQKLGQNYLNNLKISEILTLQDQLHQLITERTNMSGNVENLKHSNWEKSEQSSSFINPFNIQDQQQMQNAYIDKYQNEQKNNVLGKYNINDEQTLKFCDNIKQINGMDEKCNIEQTPLQYNKDLNCSQDQQLKEIIKKNDIQYNNSQNQSNQSQHYNNQKENLGQKIDYLNNTIQNTQTDQKQIQYSNIQSINENDISNHKSQIKNETQKILNQQNQQNNLEIQIERTNFEHKIQMLDIENDKIKNTLISDDDQEFQNNISDKSKQSLLQNSTNQSMFCSNLEKTKQSIQEEIRKSQEMTENNQEHNQSGQQKNNLFYNYQKKESVINKKDNESYSTNNEQNQNEYKNEKNVYENLQKQILQQLNSYEKEMKSIQENFIQEANLYNKNSQKSDTDSNKQSFTQINERNDRNDNSFINQKEYNPQSSFDLQQIQDQSLQQTKNFDKISFQNINDAKSIILEQDNIEKKNNEDNDIKLETKDSTNSTYQQDSPKNIEIEKKKIISEQQSVNKSNDYSYSTQEKTYQQNNKIQQQNENNLNKQKNGREKYSELMQIDDQIGLENDQNYEIQQNNQQYQYDNNNNNNYKQIKDNEQIQGSNNSQYQINYQQKQLVMLDSNTPKQSIQKQIQL